MKFFLDTNIPYSTLKAFENLNLEAVHARDIGLSQANDKEIFEFAVKNKSILVAKDLEFANPRLFPRKTHYGIIVMRLPYFFNASQFIAVLRNFLNSVEIDSLEKAVTIVKLGGYRIRKLPDVWE